MGSRSKVGSFARGVTPLSGGGTVCATRTGGVAWTTRTGAVLGLGRPAVGPATSGTCVFVTRRRRDVRTRVTASMARTLRTRQTCGGQRRRRRRRPSFFRRRRLINCIQPHLVLGDQPLDARHFGRRKDVADALDVVQRSYGFGLFGHRPKDLKQQSMWYQRVFGEWPYRTDGGLLPNRYSPLISGCRQSLYVHLDRPSLVISAT